MRRGRPERALPNNSGPITQLASELRDLRRAAGLPSYRQLAERANYSSSALSDATRGVRLPSLDVTLAFVRACSGDEDRWRSRWHEIVRALEAERPAASPMNDASTIGPRARHWAASPRWPIVVLAAVVGVEAVLSIRLERRLRRLDIRGRSDRSGSVR